MRISPVILAMVATVATSASTALGAQTTAAPIDARSVAFEAYGREQLAAGALPAARDALESAVAADPRNRDAYIGLGRVARREGLPGKAIGYFRSALAIDPKALAALAGEGEALVDKGALTLARERLMAATKLCDDPCAALDPLRSAIRMAEAKPPVTTPPAATPPAG